MHICLSFDDGNQDEKIIDLLLKYNITATFFPTAWAYQPNKYNNLKKYLPFEVGNHTLNHFNLITLDRQTMEYEIIEWQNILENELQKKIYGFAYPFGKFNNEIINYVKTKFKYARTDDKKIPFDGFNIGPNSALQGDYLRTYYNYRLSNKSLIIADHAPDTDIKKLEQFLKIAISNDDKFTTLYDYSNTL
jgi:peptidoglycan/xylan/chitin deacetylase (PgdA/CDA1 family)